MASTVQKRYFPARQMLVRGRPAQVLGTAVEVFASRGFRAETTIDETAIELQIGSAAREFWLGDRFVGRFLSGRARALVMHGFAVAQAHPAQTSDTGHPETRLTLSSVDGLETHHVVLEVIDECLDHFARTGSLVDAGEPISALELPADSPGSPKGYRAWRKRRRRA